MTDPSTTPDPTDHDSLPDLDGWELQHLLRAEMAARAAGRREALAEMAAWHKAQEAVHHKDADLASRTGRTDACARYHVLANLHDQSARHAKALAAAADDPAGPLPLRVRYRRDGLGSTLTLTVSVGPEHGGRHSGTLYFPAEELPGLRAGWPGAAFVEETSRGTG